MITLSARACQLGSSVNLRTEKHGEDNVPAVDIPIEGIMLSSEDLNELLGTPGAHDTLFSTVRGHQEPALPQIKDLVLRDKVAGADVCIKIHGTGPAKKLQLKDCKIKGLTLAPLSGGATALSITVQTSGDHVPATIGLLASHLSGQINVEISGGAIAEKKATQGELPINSLEEDPPIENSRTGRLVNLSARRAEKKAKKNAKPTEATRPH